MANNLFISYDLHSPGQDYENVAEAIKGLGTWAKVQYSLCYVKLGLSASDAGKKVWTVMRGMGPWAWGQVCFDS